jgi:hypothetical protein
MAHTEQAKVRFVVKEGPEGQHSIVVEPSLSILGSPPKLLTFNLEKMSLDEAHAIARTLDEQVQSVAVTQFET